MEQRICSPHEVNMDFTGKIIIVTGGGSGIGQACCSEFADRHGTVAIVDRDEKGGHETQRQIAAQNRRAEFFHADVSSDSQVQELIRKIVNRMGGVDVLVNNAGIQRYGTATTTSEVDWDEVLDINLKGAFLMARYAIPEIIRRGGGAIVNTASVQSVTAQRNSLAYVVSKHGLLGLTRCLALDYAKEGIRANCVLPGAIDTPMLRWAASLDDHPERVIDACNRLHPIGRMGTPEEVARAIVFLASDAASFVTGVALPVEGGLLTPTGGMMFQESGTGAKKA
jgi:NAD(P)-dependent dehydrogenase (short-subunit alcohol dehydrogenase family)